MAASNVQSNVVFLWLSSDGGTTYKKLTCLESADFSGTTSSTEEETQCGTFTGLGSNKWEFSGSGIVNLTPTAGTETSYKDVLSAWKNQTLMYVKQEYPDAAGTDFYHQGTAYITAVGNQVAVGSSMKFSITLKGNSDLDIAP